MAAIDADDQGALTEHPLSRDHIAAGMALSNAAGWNQIEADWRLFFDLGYGMGISDRAGLCATTMIIPFGPRFAWISVVLVDGRMRRRGLATRLTEWATQELAARAIVPFLDATPAGREVYLRLGFNDCWWLQRLIAQQPRHDAAAGRPADPIANSASDRTIRPITDALWSHIVAYDASVFGAARGALLAALRQRVPDAAFCAEEAGRITGFVLARDGRLATQIGPLCADRDDTAIALLAHALPRVSYPVCIDLPERHAVIREWLMASGFTVGRPFSRMALGRAGTFDAPSRLIASAGPEFG